MREFWVASGHHLTQVDRTGRMLVTDELILAWLARPEVTPPEDACAAEQALHQHLLRHPRAEVLSIEIDNLADPDARENWTLLLALRDTLVKAGTIEEGYVDLVRNRVKLPHLFYDQLMQLILRNALEGCDDVYVLRAAEMLFRPQRGYINDDALMLADDELVEELEVAQHTNPLMAMMNGGVTDLDVLSKDNAWTYWSRSDAHTMVLPFGSEPKAREGFATALEMLVRHLLGYRVTVIPMTTADNVDLRWYVGLDPAGTAIGNALWYGNPLPASLIGLFSLTFENPKDALPDVGNHPIYLLVGMDDNKVIRFKPQNLVTGLPLAENRSVDDLSYATGSA